MISLKNVDATITGAFGLWIKALYSGIKIDNPELTFSERKEAFFWLLKRLLDEEKVRMCRPDDPLGNIYPYWDADSATIIAYLRSQWPSNATSEHDPALILYFYEIPAILWVGKDGKLYGS